MNFFTLLFVAFLLLLSLTVLAFLFFTQTHTENTLPPLTIPVETAIPEEAERDTASDFPAIPSPTPYKTYQDSIITFEYPAFVEYSSSGNELQYGVNFHEIIPRYKQPLGFLSFRRTSTEFTTFEEYVADYTDFTVRNAAVFGAKQAEPQQVFAVVPETESRYSLSTTTVNGLPVLFEKRNFDSMIGNVYDMKVWLDDGTVLNFQSEFEDHTMVDAVYQSVRRSE